MTSWRVTTGFLARRNERNKACSLHLQTMHSLVRMKCAQSRHQHTMNLSGQPDYSKHSIYVMEWFLSNNYYKCVQVWVRQNVMNNNWITEPEIIKLHLNYTESGYDFILVLHDEKRRPKTAERVGLGMLTITTFRRQEVRRKDISYPQIPQQCSFWF